MGLIKSQMKNITYSKILNLFRQIVERFPTSHIILFILGCTSIIILFAVKRYCDIKFPFLSSGSPVFSDENFVYHIAVFISTFIILKGLFVFSENANSIKETKRSYQREISILVILITLVVFLYLFFFYPSVLSLLVINKDNEEGPLEWISFLFLIFGSVLFIMSFLKRGKGQNSFPIIRWTLISFALLLLIMAMEEISWGQNIFGWKTPSFFGNNYQNETNLHNFDAKGVDGWISTVYYLGYFLLLVLLPFLSITFSDISDYSFLKFFISKPYIIILGAIPCAFNGPFLNTTIFYRMFLFSSLSILIILVFAKRNDLLKGYYIITAILIVLIQSIFLFFGKTITEYGIQVSEYSELFSQYSLMLYAFDVFNKLKHSNTTNQNLILT